MLKWHDIRYRKQRNKNGNDTENNNAQFNTQNPDQLLNENQIQFNYMKEK